MKYFGSNDIQVSDPGPSLPSCITSGLDCIVDKESKPYQGIRTHAIAPPKRRRKITEL